MLTRLAWLALEVEHVAPAHRFYAETLDLAERESTEQWASRRVDEGDDEPAVADGRSAVADGEPAGGDHGSTDGDAEAVGAEGGPTERAFAAGNADLLLRRPTGVPRGGLHTHFALSIPAGEYDDWWDRLAGEYDLEERTFGSARSLYLYDPDGNCVELGQRDVDGPGIDGVFEVVLEVEDVGAAEEFYADLGFETVDRGTERRRVRMDGPTALELWAPQLGIANARGGVHVDLGYETADPEAAAAAVADRACRVERDGDVVLVRDPDGHHLTFVPGSD